MISAIERAQPGPYTTVIEHCRVGPEQTVWYSALATECGVGCGVRGVGCGEGVVGCGVGSVGCGMWGVGRMLLKYAVRWTRVLRKRLSTVCHGCFSVRRL